MTTNGTPSLGDLFHPSTVETWRSDHLGRHALLIRSSASRLGALSELDVDALIRDAPESHLDRIQGGLARAASEATAKGTPSVRVRRVQVLDAEVRRFAVALATALGEEVNVNLYASPRAESPGLAPHVDPYDVLVIQLRGRKRWELSGDPTGSLAPESLSEVGASLVGNEGTLETRAGDLLYLPRGLVHRAENPGPEPSFHLATSILVKTMRSCVDWLASELERRLRAERPLPLGAGAADREAALEELRREAMAILDDEDRVASFTAHREVVEYEGMLLPPDAKAARPRR